jgi:hypothetical protein
VTPNGRSIRKQFRRFRNRDRHFARPDVGQDGSNASPHALIWRLLGPTDLARQWNHPAIFGRSAGLEVLGLIGGLVGPQCVAKGNSDSAAAQRVIGLPSVRSGSAECPGIISPSVRRSSAYRRRRVGWLDEHPRPTSPGIASLPPLPPGCLVVPHRSSCHRDHQPVAAANFGSTSEPAGLWAFIWTTNA